LLAAASRAGCGAAEGCGGEKGWHNCGVNLHRNELLDCVAALAYSVTKQKPISLWQPHARCGKVWPGTKHPLSVHVMIFFEGDVMIVNVH
jgi:hypothetical protein